MLIIYNKAYAKQGLVFSFMKEKCLQLIPKHSICKGSDVVFLVPILMRDVRNR